MAIDNEIFKRAGEGAGVFAALAYAIATIFAKRRQAINEVQSEADRETERTIKMLKEQRDSLDKKVDALSVKIDNLTYAIQVYACPNAPNCQLRPEHQATVAEILAI